MTDEIERAAEHLADAIEDAKDELAEVAEAPVEAVTPDDHEQRISALESSTETPAPASDHGVVEAAADRIESAAESLEDAIEAITPDAVEEPVSDAIDTMADIAPGDEAVAGDDPTVDDLLEEHTPRRTHVLFKPLWGSKKAE